MTTSSRVNDTTTHTPRLDKPISEFHLAGESYGTRELSACDPFILGLIRDAVSNKTNDESRHVGA